MSFETAGGDVVELWPHRPDGSVLERLEWKTDVIPSYDGSEQRVELIQYPRRSFEFACSMSNRARREAENLLFHWQAQPFALPVWMDGQPLPSSITGGTDAIPCSTANRDYHVGGLVAVMADERTYDLLEIESIAADSITTVQVTSRAYIAGATTVAPCRVARLPDEASLSRFTGDDAYMAQQWICTDESQWTPASETTYLSYPVQASRPNWIEDVQADYVRKMTLLDPGVGRRYFDEASDGPVLTQTHRWLLDGKAAIANFRSWLYARRGRVSAFWQPSFAQDLEVVAPISNVATTVDVQNCGYSDHVDQAVNRRDIRIELRNGTAYHRRITSSAVLTPDTERLTISSALGATIQPSDIAVVNFMQLSRLDADAAEIAWWKHDAAECALTVRGFRNVI